MTVEEQSTDARRRRSVHRAAWARPRFAMLACWRGIFAAQRRHRGTRARRRQTEKSLEMANKLGARYALIVGDDEIAAGRTR